MTVYYPHGRCYELSRPDVERSRDEAARTADAIRDGRAYRDVPSDERTAWEHFYRSETLRLTAVLECIDHGDAELPIELYPAVARRAA